MKFCEIFCIRSDISNFGCLRKFSRPHIYIKKAHMLDQFSTHHRVVHNGRSPSFQGLLFNKRTTYMAQILQSFSYKVCWITLPKFNTLKLFILNLGASTIMDQTARCYNVTTSETGLYGTQSVFSGLTCIKHISFNGTLLLIRNQNFTSILLCGYFWKAHCKSMEPLKKNERQYYERKVLSVKCFDRQCNDEKGNGLRSVQS